MAIKKILVVDDDQGVRESFVLLFETNSFCVEQATNGKEGFEKALSFKPELIILDVVMPVMNGIETAKKIRANESTKYIPIIFCTGTHFDEVIKAKISDSEVLSKPFTFEQLNEKMNKVLRR